MGEAAGIACRILNDFSISTFDSVASSNVQKYEIIRIRIMSTKMW